MGGRYRRACVYLAHAWGGGLAVPMARTGRTAGADDPLHVQHYAKFSRADLCHTTHQVASEGGGGGGDKLNNII